MSIHSRLFRPVASKPLIFSVLSGALFLAPLLAPLCARAQDAPDAVAPDAVAPDAVAPDAVAPDAVAPDAVAPDATVPNVAAPDAAAGNAVAPKPVTTAWTSYKGDAQRTGATTANIKLPLTLQWRYSSIGPARSYTTAPLVIGAPGSQRVVFASGNVVYANDINTGAQVWKSPEVPSSFTVPLALLSTEDGDLILALQNSGRLTAFKTANGARAWEVDCGGLSTESGPIVVQTRKGTRVICALNTGKMVAVDPSGVLDPDWKLQLGPLGNSAASSMSLSRDGSQLFIMGSDSQLYIINVREARTVYSLTQSSRSSIAPVVSGDTVFTANARRVSAWRINDGTAAWNLNTSSEVLGSPALKTGEGGGLTGATLFFGTREGQFMAVNALDGKIKWQKKLLDNVSVTGSPLVMPGAVVVGTAAGTLIGFAPDSGDIVWQYRLQTERVRDLTPRPDRSSRRGRGGGRGGRGGGRGGEGGGFPGGGFPGGGFPGGGGDFGGEGGGFPGGAGGGASSREEKRTYGVSSAPAAIDQKLFVLGDDAALYAFTSQAFDADPPRVIEPSISVNASDRQLLALLLSSDRPQIVPGVGPFYFAAQIDDVGSGVDPDSIVVSINDKPLDAARVFYGRASSVLTVTLVDVQKGDTPLEDGLKKIVITAKDYAGNTINFSTNFSVDNTVPAPQPPTAQFRNGFGDGAAQGGAMEGGAMGGDFGP